MDVLSSRFLLSPGNFESSRRFYADVLGLAVFREWGDASSGGVVFYVGGGLLELSGTATAAPTEATRLLLQVRDLNEQWRRLQSDGIPIDAPPEVKPWGLIEMTVRDPDGLTIVLIEVPADHPQRRAH